MCDYSRKKDKLDKERISNWSYDKYKVLDIQESMGQKFYKLEGRDRVVMRSEILLVDWGWFPFKYLLSNTIEEMVNNNIDKILRRERKYKYVLEFCAGRIKGIQLNIIMLDVVAVLVLV